MPAQAKTIFICLFAGVLCAIAAGESGDDKFQSGDYREALRAYQAETLDVLVKMKKATANQGLADSPTWEVDSKKEQMALCLFEKGLQTWLNSKPKEAAETWIESQKQILAEGPTFKKYYRRTQLAILQASWNDLSSNDDRLEAVSKVAVVIQDLPLPERSWDFFCQIGVEQQVLAIVEYARLLPKVAEKGFLPALFQKQLEIHRNRQLARFLTKAPAGNEPTHEALVDRALFESFGKVLWNFFDEYLQSPTGGGAYVLSNRDNFRLVRVLMTLDAPTSEAFDKMLKFWLENLTKPQPQVVSGVLQGLLQIAMDSTDPEYANRILKGVTPYFDRVAWSDDDFRVRLSLTLKERSFFKVAAQVLEPTIKTATDKDVRAERLSALVEMKLKANDFAGAYTNAQQAMTIYGGEVPPSLNRTMASVCINLKKYEEAVKYLQKFVAVCDEGEQRVEAQYLMGWVYSLDKKFDLARICFKEVIESHPDSLYAKKSQDYLRALPKSRGE